MTMDWVNLYKVRIANTDKSFQKHEIIKLLIVMKTLQKYKRKDWLRIYTEFELENSCRPDVYVENIKDKSIIIYEIQKDFSPQWLEKKTIQYESYTVPNFNSIDLIIIPLKELSDDIQELSKQLDEYII